MTGLITKFDTPMISSADRCGREVLGMSGSLTNYINTGNPGCSLDKFEKCNKKNSNNKNKFLNFIKFLGVAAVLGVCGYVIAKKCPKNFQETLAKFGNNLSTKVKNIAESIKKTKMATSAKKIADSASASNAGTTIKDTANKIANSSVITKIKKGLSGLVSKFKK